MYNNINYEILVLSSSHDVIENMVRFVDSYFVFNKCFGGFLSEFCTWKLNFGQF